MIGIIVAVIVAAVVLVPICNSLTEGNGGSGGGGVTGIQVANPNYVSPSVFMTDEIGWTAMTNTDMEAYFPTSGDYIEGYSNIVSGRNKIAFVDDISMTECTLTYWNRYLDSSSNGNPIWYISFPGQVEGFGDASSWSLSSDGNITITYKVSGMSNYTTKTFKALYLWYDAPTGNYHNLSGITYDQNLEKLGGFAGVGDYIGISGQVQSQYNPGMLPFVYMGQIPESMNVSISYTDYQFDQATETITPIPSTANIDLTAISYSVQLEDGRYYFPTAFAVAPTYTFEGHYEDRVMTLDWIKQKMSEDDGLWGFDYSDAPGYEDTILCFNGFGKIGTMAQYWVYPTDGQWSEGRMERVATTAADFAMVFDNGYGTGCLLQIEREKEVGSETWSYQGLEITEDIVLGEVNISSYDTAYLSKANMGNVMYYRDTFMNNQFTGQYIAQFSENANGFWLIPNSEVISDEDFDWSSVPEDFLIPNPVSWETALANNPITITNLAVKDAIYPYYDFILDNTGKAYMFESPSSEYERQGPEYNEVAIWTPGTSPLNCAIPMSYDYRVLAAGEGDSSNGGGSSGGNDLGVAGTIIGIIPVFVILAILMGAAGLFYQNRKTI